MFWLPPRLISGNFIHVLFSNDVGSKKTGALIASTSVSVYRMARAQALGCNLPDGAEPEAAVYQVTTAQGPLGEPTRGAYETVWRDSAGWYANTSLPHREK